MKCFSKWLLTLSFFLIISIFGSFAVNAQGGPGGGSDPGCSPDGFYPDGTPCPLDSSLYILLGIGVIYGLKKVREQKKVLQLKK